MSGLGERERESIAARVRRIGSAVGGFLARATGGFSRRVASGLGRVFAPLNRWNIHFNVGRLLRWTILAVASAIAIGVVIVFLLVFYPETQIPPAEPIDTVRYLDQGWGNSRESPERDRYYYLPQGASIHDLRYAWFVNFEKPWGRGRFADPNHLRALGFIVEPVPSHANPDQLPIGFARRFDDRLQEYMLDVTCSACHTGQLNVTRNGVTTAIRIDGGQAMHAFTAMKIGHFLPVLLGSAATTWVNPFKFNRFAWKVLGEEHYADGKSQLHAELGAWLRDMAGQGWSDFSRGLYPSEEGFGRTDALARIGNTVFGDHLIPANYRVGNGPVSYPYLWNIWRFDWVQYNASVSQPMARNVGEVMGTGATFHLVDPYGRPTPPAERYRTSILFDNLQRIENTLQELKPPAWPEDVLGPIDRAKAERGRQLFNTHCIGCHGPHVAPAAIQHRDAPGRSADEPLWTIRTKALTDIGTDPHTAENFARNRIDLRNSGLELTSVRSLLKQQLDEAKRRAEAAIPELRQEIARQKAARAAPASLAALEDALADAVANLPTDESIARRLDELDLAAVQIGQGLNILGLVIRDRYYAENRFTPAQRACSEGFGTLDIPQVVAGYKPRPLEGVWATPPFLHNGSVPNLYELLSPANERSRVFWVGRREFDPVKVGYLTERSTLKGGFRFDTRVAGNYNIGHEFRAGHVPYDETNPQPQYGVIGPELSVADRYAIIEYLKIHKDPAPVRTHPPVDCLAASRSGS
jgi:hypothetical protein